MAQARLLPKLQLSCQEQPRSSQEQPRTWDQEQARSSPGTAAQDLAPGADQEQTSSSGTPGAVHAYTLWNRTS